MENEKSIVSEHVVPSWNMYNYSVFGNSMCSALKAHNDDDVRCDCDPGGIDTTIGIERKWFENKLIPF